MSAASLGLLGGLGQSLNQTGKGFYARVRLAVLEGGVRGIDALEDDRELPVAEGHEEIELGELAAGALGLAGLGLVALGEARRNRRGLPQRDVVLARLGPVDHQQ